MTFVPYSLYWSQPVDAQASDFPPLVISQQEADTVQTACMVGPVTVADVYSRIDVRVSYMHPSGTPSRANWEYIVYGNHSGTAFASSPDTTVTVYGTAISVRLYPPYARGEWGEGAIDVVIIDVRTYPIPFGRSDNDGADLTREE